MNTHAEQELLSAFVDGELTEREQVTLEAHLASCADCRALLGALRATLGDLASIPEAVPSEQDSWALRSAIAKERRLARRGRRWYLISGGAAAALVAILAFALATGGGGAADKAGRQFLAHAPELRLNSTNYTDSSARQVLLNFSSVAQDSLQSSGAGTGGSKDAFTADSSAPAGGPMNETYQSRSLTAGSAKSGAADEAGLSRCVDTVTGSTDQPLTARYYEAASFDGEPAFLLVFEVTDAKRLELWVVRRDDCQTLFFAQTRA
jgi:putative zinc finger protein